MVTVCIPTVGESPHLSSLIDTLVGDPSVSIINLYVNEPDKVERVQEMGSGHGERIKVERVPQKSIYIAWNRAIRFAKPNEKVAIFNDDIEFLGPSPVSCALDHWFQNPQVAILGFDHTGSVASGIQKCTGSYRHGGIPGFAFMVDPEKVGLVDTRFQFWYGDDDLFFATEDAGHTLARCSVPVKHEMSYTASRRGWVNDAIERDTIEFKKKWGSR